jgi:hypothetical protein
MAIHAKKLLIVRLCLWVLAHQQKVYGLKSIPLLLRRQVNKVPEEKPRLLAERNLASLHDHKKGYQAMAPSSVDPNRMNDRRV